MDPLSCSSSSSPLHVSVVPSELLFNHKMPSSLPTASPSSQSVSITNHTRGKLRWPCVWFTVASHYDTTKHALDFFSIWNLTRVPVLLFLLINLVSFPCDFYSSLVWTAAQDSPFSVSPSSCDLAPLKSTSFRVNYDPKQLHTLHAVQLECFAYNKVMFLPYIQNYVEEYSVSCSEFCWHSVLWLLCRTVFKFRGRYCVHPGVWLSES